MNKVIYTWDDRDLSELGLVIKSSEGIVSIPEFKAVTSYDWSEYHGSIVDLKNRRFKARTIKLTGYIYTTDSADLLDKSHELFELMGADGLHRLKIEVPDAEKPLYFLVYLTKKIEVKKSWKPNREQMAEVTIELSEPEPVKRVITFAESVAVPSITITTASAVNIRTSDGNESLDVQGTNVVYKPVFASGSSRYVIITGNIDQLTTSTNGTTEWSKL